MYLGSWDTGDYITFYINTHNTSTGSASDADSAPTYRIYEDETGTAIATGSMSLLDDSNTTGFYSERIQLLSSTGYEKGKSYVIYISATVNSITGTTNHTFQIQANVDSKTVSDKTGYSITGTVTVGTNNDKTGYTVSIVQDKTGYSLSVDPPTVNEIWSATTRTLTSSGSVTIDYSSVANAVWNEQRSLHTSTGTFGEGVNVYGSVTLDEVAQDVWDYTIRTLTSTGSSITAQDVWDYTTRTLTSSGSVDASTIWAYPTRTVTGGTIDDISSTPSLEDVIDGIWNEQRSLHTSTGTFGEGVSSVQGNLTGSVGSVVNPVTAGTVSDKTGYSLSSSQIFNMVGNVSGNISGNVGSVTTVSDKTGYSLSVAPPTTSEIWSATTRTLTSSGNVYVSVGAEQIANAVWGALRSVYTSTGTFGEYLNSTLTSTGIDNIVNGIIDSVVEGSTTVIESLRLILSILVGNMTKVESSTISTYTFRDTTNSTNRVVSSNTTGSRTIVSIDKS
jgi:hypothetical protein